MEKPRLYTIQNDKKKMKSILKKISKDSLNIIYTNCITFIEIGRRNINIIFDTILYNEKDNILIMIMKDGLINEETLIELLDKMDIKYHNIVFDNNLDNLYFPKNTKELYMTDNKRIIKNAISNSINNNINRCIYYPNVEGNFSIVYYNRHGRKEKLYEEELYGLIDLDDKMILINKENNYNETLSTLEEIDKLELRINKNPYIPNNVTQKTKVKVKTK